MSRRAFLRMAAAQGPVRGLAQRRDAIDAVPFDTAGKFAVPAKTARNTVIGFVVLGYAIGEQGQLPVAEVSELRARIPADFGVDDSSFRSRELGVSRIFPDGRFY